MGRFLAFLLLALEVAVLAIAGALVQGLPLAAAQTVSVFLSFRSPCTLNISLTERFMQRGAALTNVLGPEVTVPAGPAPQPTVSPILPKFGF